MENYKSFKARLLENKDIRKFYNELYPESSAIKKNMRKKIKFGLKKIKLPYSQ